MKRRVRKNKKPAFISLPRGYLDILVHILDKSLVINESVLEKIRRVTKNKDSDFENFINLGRNFVTEYNTRKKKGLWFS